MKNLKIHLFRKLKLNETTYDEGFHSFYRFEVKYQRWLFFVDIMDENYLPYTELDESDFKLNFLKSVNPRTVATNPFFFKVYTVDTIREQKILGITGQQINIETIIHPNPTIIRRALGYYTILVSQMIHETTYLQEQIFESGDFAADSLEIIVSKTNAEAFGDGIFLL